jgi:hypothetical protein
MMNVMNRGGCKCELFCDNELRNSVQILLEMILVAGNLLRAVPSAQHS